MVLLINFITKLDNVCIPQLQTFLTSEICIPQVSVAFFFWYCHGMTEAECSSVSISDIFLFPVTFCFVYFCPAQDLFERCSLIGVTSLFCCRVYCENVHFREKKEISDFLAVYMPSSNIFYLTSNPVSQRRQDTGWKITGNNVTNRNTLCYIYYVHIIFL